MKDLSKNKRIAMMVIITILSAIVYGCIFPVLNFSLEKPEIPTIHILLNVLVFYLIVEGIGTTVPKLFPQWTLLKSVFYNFSVCTAGLIARYLLEFGEISNTYNFTVSNIVFYLLITLGLAAFEVNKNMRKEKSAF